jgi:hypothetical protein
MDDLLRFMIPLLDLDHPTINPDVARCLRDFVAAYIMHFKLGKRNDEVEDIKRASQKVLDCFDFNSDHYYDPQAYLAEFEVSSRLLS